MAWLHDTLRYPRYPARRYLAVPRGGEHTLALGRGGIAPGWQDRGVEHGAGLTLTSELLMALDVEAEDGRVCSPEVVLAACLHRLAVGLGLARRWDAPDHSVIRHAGLPAPAFELMAHYFGSSSGGLDDEAVRDGLCAALDVVARDPRALKAVDRNQLLTGEGLLQFAQIYWNLDADGERHGLPIPTGQKLSSKRPASMKVPGADLDYANLTLKERADRTPGYSRAAGAFYKRGARLVAVVSTQIAKDATSPSAPGASLLATRTGRRTKWSIVWPIPPSRGNARAAESHSKTVKRRVDPIIASLRQLRRQAANEGKLSDASILSLSIIRMLQDRSERRPGDLESVLVDEYLLTGATLLMADRTDEALSHFEDAARVSETLLDLKPDHLAHKAQLAAARTLTGVTQFRAARPAEAESALLDGTRLSQDLTDEDATNEDLLALSLSTRGMLYVMEGRDGASEPLHRALKIAQKLAKRAPDEATTQLQLAHTLLMLGMSYVASEDNQLAEDALGQSLALAETQLEDDADNRVAQILLGTDLASLGSIYLFSDREGEAERVLARAIPILERLIGQHPDEGTQLTLAGALHNLGLVYAVTERAEKALTSFGDAVKVSQRLVENAPHPGAQSSQMSRASTFLGSANFYLALILLDQHRVGEAEAVLVEAIAIFQSRPTDAGDQQLLVAALDSLVDLYVEQGRDAEADETRTILRNLGDQSSGSAATLA